MPPPLILINAVGLTPRLLAHAPRLSALAQAGWVANMPEVLPAVTCTAQATILTGQLPNVHGVVANGWLFHDTNEVRFWQQCNRLMRAEPIYETARKVAIEQGRDFKAAKLFWWFNQGAAVDFSVTPKPWYAVNGDKAFDVAGTPDGLCEKLKKELGPFPFPAFWGPMAGLPSTAWIAKCAASVLRDSAPDLTLVYLPHLDYEPQRRGPGGCDMAKYVRELDAACAPLLDVAAKLGARVWVCSEYGHCDVDFAIYPNRELLRHKLLTVRRGPFGDQLDLYGSRAFAVCDHQMAHLYVRHMVDVPQVKEVLAALPGVAEVLSGQEREKYHLNHERSGDVIALSGPRGWFAYPFWENDKFAPDYARSVAIHHKPGFDPCELFFDPKLIAPKLHAARRLVQKKLGFRTNFDVVPLDASIVKGSHGLAAADPLDRPILTLPTHWIGRSSSVTARNPPIACQ
ncbi:MAG: alkaline phosphatase family protein [Fimbriiglobus sp.]|nr:alkaline phosphatase family protein [Fimbriiglobus sp.]